MKLRWDWHDEIDLWRERSEEIPKAKEKGHKDKYHIEKHYRKGEIEMRKAKKLDYEMTYDELDDEMLDDDMYDDEMLDDDMYDEEIIEDKRLGDKRARHCHGKRHCFDVHACDRTVCRAFELAQPFSIRPRVNARPPEVNCGGDIELRLGHRRCRNRNREFDFTATQTINVAIPIEFGAEVCYSRPCVTDEGECDTTRKC
jgi:hypothetical protein